MGALCIAVVLAGFAPPKDGPVSRKQVKKALTHLRSCAQSAEAVSGMPGLNSGSQYAELLSMELRGLEKKRWRSDPTRRAFRMLKKGAFGQRYRFELDIGTEHVQMVRYLANPRGERSAYGILWQGDRLMVFPMTEACTAAGCAWQRTKTIELTCRHRAFARRSL